MSLPSAAIAIEPGATAPSFSLSNLEGAKVSLKAPTRGEILILYFFDATDESAKILSALEGAVSKMPDAMSLLAVSRGNADELRKLFAGKNMRPASVLSDGSVTIFSYGLQKKLPAVVIVGPGGMVGAELASISTSEQALILAANALISLKLPAHAGKIYQSLPRDMLKRETVKLGAAYAYMLAGDTKAAGDILGVLAGSSSLTGIEARAGLGYLEYLKGNDENASAKSKEATGNGFAEYVDGLAGARSGKVKEASDLFHHAVNGKFRFNWQQALAHNMAARTAEIRGDFSTALSLYRKAFSLDPFNTMINANLAHRHWTGGNIPAARKYLGNIISLKSDDPLLEALIAEFETAAEFNADKAAQKKLGQRLSAEPGKRPRAAAPLALVLDLNLIDCFPERNHLEVAAAGLLKQKLESKGALVTVKRPESLFAAKHIKLSPKNMQKLQKAFEVAEALSTDYLVQSEVGSYEGMYFLNIRIVSVPTQEIVGVVSERINLLNDLAPTIETAASQALDKIADDQATTN